MKLSEIKVESDRKYNQFEPGQKVKDREGKEHVVARQDGVKVFMQGHSYGHFHPNNLTLVESKSGCQMVALFREPSDDSSQDEQFSEIEEIVKEYNGKILKKKFDDESIALLIKVSKSKIDDLYDELDGLSDSIGVYTDEHGEIPASAMSALE
jgi:hypothetical protein